MRVRRLTLTTLVTLGVVAGVSLLWSAAALAVLEEPAVSDEPASVVGQSTVSLAGQVNPESQPVSVCEFQFVSETVFNATGFTVAPGLASCAPSASELGEGDSSEAVGAGLSGLEANTTYYYRLLATNATGTSEGATQHFLTLPNPPTVATGQATEVGANTATIAGSVSPGSNGVNSDTIYYFQYSTDTSYSQQMPLVAGNAGEGTSAVPETAQLTGLEPDTTYHYRIVASNDNTNSAGGAPQVVLGEGKAFTTPATPPVLGPPEAGAITQTGVTITATIDARGLPAHYELRLADTQGSLEPQAAGNTTGSTTEPLAVNVASLTPGTVYYYKLIAVNPDGTVETPEASFTTVPAPAPQSTTLFPATPLLSIPNVAFPTEEAATSTPTPRVLTRAQKLKNALKACHKEKGAKRAVCERQARKKYGAVKARKKKKK